MPKKLKLAAIRSSRAGGALPDAAEGGWDEGAVSAVGRLLDWFQEPGGDAGRGRLRHSPTSPRKPLKISEPHQFERSLQKPRILLYSLINWDTFSNCP